MSMPNTRFRRCAQLIATDGMYAGFAGAKTGHRGTAFGCCRRLRIRRRGMLTSPTPPGLGHPSPVTAVGGENPVEPYQVGPRLGHQRYQPGDEVQGLENDVRSAVAVRGLQLVADVAVPGERPGRDSHCWPSPPQSRT
jgi:hypothetical protein